MLRIAKFTTESLKKIEDGKPAAMFDAAMRQVIRDCYERPGNKSKRTVNLSVSVVPIIEDDGECERVRFAFDCSSSTPKMSTKEYEGRVTRNGDLLISQEFADSVDQHSLLPDDGDPSDSFKPSDGRSAAAGE